MLGAFVCAGGGPVDVGLVVIVNWGGGNAVGHVLVRSSIPDIKELFDAFNIGQDFGLARALCCLFLPDGFACDGAA